MFSHLAPVRKLLSDAQATFREVWEDVTEGLAFLENLALKSTPALCFAIGWALKSLRTAIHPVLPGGMELYHWFYFRWKDGAVPRAEVDESAQMRAAELLRCGLESAGCLQSIEAPEFQGCLDRKPSAFRFLLYTWCRMRLSNLEKLRFAASWSAGVTSSGSSWS